MTLNRVGDPQKLQDRIREMSSQISKLDKRNDALTKRNTELARDIFVLKHGNDEISTERPTSPICQPVF